jgi:O-antigen/teichoic acid export membrane protein
LQDYTRQPLYVLGRVPAAFCNDFVSWGGQILAIAIASYLDVLSASLALVIVAATSGFALLVGLVQLRSSIDWRPRVKEIREFLRETWQFGRWTLGGTFLSTASTYLQPFVLAAFWGAAAAGELRAIVALMGPARIIVRGAGMGFTPLAASTVERDGKVGLKSLVKLMVRFIVPLMALYCLLVSIRPTFVVTLLFGEEFASSAGWLMPMVASGFLLLAIIIPLDIGLRSLRVTRPVFRGGAIAFTAFWTIGVPAIYFFGLFGAGLTFVTSQTIFLVVLFRNYRREMAGV